MNSIDSDSRVAVYTAIFNDYDVLIDPVVTESGVDYICFTDNPELKSDVWETKIANPMTDPVLSNRRIKILAHEYLEDYELSIYIDGNIQIRQPVKPLIENYLLSADFALYKHPERSSLFAEANACIEQKKAEEEPVRDQIDYYRNAGFPDNEELTENRVLFRRHHQPEIKDLMWSWWREVSERVSRDQLSLMFVLWDQDFEYNLIPHSVQEVPQFAIYPHRPDGYLGLVWPYWMSIRTEQNPDLWQTSLALA